jgi:hypothetical protein
MFDAVLLGEVLELRHGIGADTHDVGVGGLELRQVRLEAADLLRSGRAERVHERVDHHRTFS